MGSTALQIVTQAYRHHNLNEVTSFSTTQEFPYKLGLDIINNVIRTMNRLGNYWFCETKTALTYAPSTSTYNYTSLAIDPRRVIRIRKEATNYWGDLVEINWKDFNKLYRSSSITSAQPTRFAKFADNFYLDAAPDQDYSMYVYHYKDMPLIVNTTDTFLIPERDEDVLIDGVYQLLGAEMGRWDLGTAVQAMNLKIQPLLAEQKKDTSIPVQMPAAF